jgi:hypothetical protein
MSAQYYAAYLDIPNYLHYICRDKSRYEKFKCFVSISELNEKECKLHVACIEFIEKVMSILGKPRIKRMYVNGIPATHPILQDFVSHCWKLIPNIVDKDVDTALVHDCDKHALLYNKCYARRLGLKVNSKRVRYNRKSRNPMSVVVISGDKDYWYMLNDLNQNFGIPCYQLSIHSEWKYRERLDSISLVRLPDICYRCDGTGWFDQDYYKECWTCNTTGIYTPEYK